jgi:hypothetical protein
MSHSIPVLGVSTRKKESACKTRHQERWKRKKERSSRKITKRKMHRTRPSYSPISHYLGTRTCLPTRSCGSRSINVVSVSFFVGTGEWKEENWEAQRIERGIKQAGNQRRCAAEMQDARCIPCITAHVPHIPDLHAPLYSSQRERKTVKSFDSALPLPKETPEQREQKTQ